MAFFFQLSSASISRISSDSAKCGVSKRGASSRPAVAKSASPVRFFSCALRPLPMRRFRSMKAFSGRRSAMA
jgi:hypothetical protein